eukprot:jgi/Bigna1/131147/aug1.13_g5855
MASSLSDYYRDQSKDAKVKTANGYDAEGFDPEADTVGAGIYGGIVKKDEKGDIIWGKQYQNHNKALGPIYAGTGYTEMTKALRVGKVAIDQVLKKVHTLHRMASNDLAVGAKALLKAGANPYKSTKYGEDAFSIASQSSAFGVLKVLKEFVRDD